MYCINCGKQITPEQPCPCGYTAQPAPPPAPQYGTNGKLYGALAYINLFWLIGMLAAPEKNDPKVRFHVGQGLIAYVATMVGTVGISVLYMIFLVLSMTGLFRSAVTDSVLSGSYSFFSGFMVVNAVYIILISAMTLLSFVWTITGLVNAVNGREKKLFLIGGLAFYK